LTGSAIPEPDTGRARPSGASLRKLFYLDPSVAFLNHGSFGATPRPVLEVCQEWQRRLEREPVRFFVDELPKLLAAARRELGGYVGAAADEVVFLTNATTAVNAVARSLRLGPGDEVLATDHEYGGCDRTLRFVCEKRGARYVRQHISMPPASPESVADELWQAVTPRTRLLFFSHVASPTGMAFPAEILCRRARSSGILTLVDGAHAAGQVDLGLGSLGADFYAGNCHKWMMAPKGAGFLFVRPEVQPHLEPIVVSWGWQAEPWFTTGSRFVDLYEWRGTGDPAPSLSVPAAIAFLEEHDWPRRRAECHRLLRQALAAIEGLTGLPPMAPVDSFFHQMGIAALPPLADPAAFQRRLYEEFSIEVPLMEWDGRPFLRVSIQAYNTQEDVERLIAALERLLPVGGSGGP
jgi:isopenicillin-N epimerase